MPTQTASLIEELLNLGERALEHALNSRHEFKKHAQNALQDLALKCDLVPREEFDAAMAMISKLTMTQKELKSRIDAIESKMHMSSTSKKVTQKKQSLRSVKHNKRRKNLKK